MICNGRDSGRERGRETERDRDREEITLSRKTSTEKVLSFFEILSLFPHEMFF